MRVNIKFACTECKRYTHTSEKNKKNNPDRMEMNMYCPFCKKHTVHKESKQSFAICTNLTLYIVGGHNG